VWLLAVGLVLLAAGLAGATVGAAHVARHRAQAAADLGALAGAVHAIEGQPAACARAAEIVTANGARLTSCELAGLDLTVTVAVAPPPVTGLGRPAVATARAGPVRAGGAS
jgi:secretion/DNA translocation related TadE-like protein